MAIGPDFTKGADHLTLDSITGYLGRNPKGADMKEMVALMRQLDAKFKETPQRMILSAIMQAKLAPILERIAETSNKYGDKYGLQMIEDMKAGRTDRLTPLAQLCALNCYRLDRSQNTDNGGPFDTMRKYLLDKHGADVRNPEHRWMYVPAATPESASIWSLINDLAAVGGVIIRENIQVREKNEPINTVTVIQLCDIS